MSDGPRVALTLDAEHPDRPLCPPGNAERLLDALGEASIRVTFFVQGRWATAHPDLARRIGSEGHRVGLHSKYHARMTLFSDAGLERDVFEGQAEVAETTGCDPRPWFRCPFDDGHDDPRVQAALERLGYRDVSWNVAAEDWEPDRTPEAVRRDTVRGALAHGDGAVVLLHTWPGPTGRALPLILQDLRASDVRFVTLDQLEPEQLP